MKNNIYSSIFLISFFCISFVACSAQTDGAAQQVVKDYWTFALNGKIDEANKLTAHGVNIKEQPPTTKVARADGKNDCCLQEFISEFELKFEKVLSEEVDNENVGQEISAIGINGDEISYRIAPTTGFKLETIDKKGVKANVVVCLGKAIENDTWKIKKITLIDENETVRKKCFVK